MTELVTYGSVGGMASNGCLYPDTLTAQSCAVSLCSFGQPVICDVEAVEKPTYKIKKHLPT